jgi:hypothetical protein
MRSRDETAGSLDGRRLTRVGGPRTSLPDAVERFPGLLQSSRQVVQLNREVHGGLGAIILSLFGGLSCCASHMRYQDRWSSLPQVF